MTECDSMSIMYINFDEIRTLWIQVKTLGTITY